MPLSTLGKMDPARLATLRDRAAEFLQAMDAGQTV